MVVGDKNSLTRVRKQRPSTSPRMRQPLALSISGNSETKLKKRIQSAREREEQKLDRDEQKGLMEKEYEDRNPWIELQQQSHHRTRRPASAHLAKRRVLVSTPIVSKQRSGVASPLSPGTAQQAAKTQHQLVHGPGSVDAIADSPDQKWDAGMDDSVKDIITLNNDDSLDNSNDLDDESRDTVAATLDDLGMNIRSSRLVRSTSARRSSGQAGLSRNTWLRCASASVKRRMREKFAPAQFRNLSLTNDIESVQRFNEESPTQTSSIQHMHHQQQQIQAQLLYHQRQQQHQRQSPQYSHHSKQSHQKDTRPVVRPASAHRVIYRHADKKKAPGRRLVAPRSPQRKGKAPKLRKTSARGRRRIQSSSMKALKAMGVARDKKKSKKKKGFSKASSPQWKLEVAGGKTNITYSCSQTGKHLWGERTCRVCGILRDDEFIRQELATRSL